MAESEGRGCSLGRLVLLGCMMLGRGKGWLMPPVKGLESRGLEGRGQQICPSWDLGQCRPFSLHLPTTSVGLGLGVPCQPAMVSAVGVSLTHGPCPWAVCPC